MSSTVQNPIYMNQAWVDANRKKVDPSSLNRYMNYGAEARGAFRYCQVVKGLCQIEREMVSVPSPLVKKLDQTAGGGIAMLGMLRLPHVTREAFAAVSDLKQAGPFMARKLGIAWREAADALGSWGKSIGFFTGNPVVRSLTQYADLTTDTADLGLAISDYREAAKLEAAAAGEVKEVCTFSKNYYLLRIAKAVTAVVASVFALILMFTGAQLLPTLAMVILSLATAILAIRRDVWEGEGRVIKFDRPVIV